MSGHICYNKKNDNKNSYLNKTVFIAIRQKCRAFLIRR